MQCTVYCTNKQTTGTQFSGQLFVYNCVANKHSGKKLTFISTFLRFLEVFVQLIILSKSDRTNSFAIVFTWSRAFQRYQTWYGNNYLNLINYWAGQKKGEVLVSLHRATSHDVARRCNTKSGTKSGTDRQTHTHRHTHRHTHTHTAVFTELLRN